ncbi:hypothetical protein HZH66_009956 [Vespula vulgaris]|uniref:FAD dependent oxidoreductase domain-containing protein n=1 Tax=Vespula vulgaris TaxID=7454 RepID=A0A834MYV9_VESVU|nr:D-aspartate oxidase [Vespula vulgaris]KAF7388819.1 hypothetical protein HZH66_009956 [Vespula vulgaris]
MKIAVIGGGAVGLTTALQVQRTLHNAEITIFASDFDNIVSNVAAGIFRVGSSYSGPTEEITRKWIEDSYSYYDSICKLSDASKAGITTISGYIFANSPSIIKNHWMEKLVPIYRNVTKEEFQLVGGNWKFGCFFTTLLTECKLYLPWILQQLKHNGAVVKKQKIDSLKELTTEYNIIMNCSGLEARNLCSDRHMVPIRGQIIKVAAPWLKTFFYGELDTYIIPGFNGVVTLGGTRNFDSENMKLCPYESAAIRTRCETLVPSLRTVENIREEVGLRPHRDGGVRVEAEFIANGCRKTTIIHNYGHGGYGVCTAPGTAQYAVQLAINAHRSSIAKL